jgi:hypothetical protein
VLYCLFSIDIEESVSSVPTLMSFPVHLATGYMEQCTQHKTQSIMQSFTFGSVLPGNTFTRHVWSHMSDVTWSSYDTMSSPTQRSDSNIRRYGKGTRSVKHTVRNVTLILALQGNTVRSLTKLNATVTFRLPVGTAVTQVG